MISGNWRQALQNCADPERARHYGELFEATEARGGLAGMENEQARILAALFSGSKALSSLLISHPDWLSILDRESLQFVRRRQGLEAEVNAWLIPRLEKGEFADALREIRQFKNRQLLRLGARDLARLGTMGEITQELSSVADVCLGAVYSVCWQQLLARTGKPYHQDASGAWRPTTGCVLGMGKLGGEELNYSSDVDVIFVYSEEGGVFKEPPGKGRKTKPVLANHHFFNRLAESFIAEVGRLTAEGSLYRIDLRLRPEGDSGPLSRSLASYENYYAQWGQTWERMMLIKARGVGGDAALAAEFLEMIQPFRYPRSIQEGVLREVAAMKDRIENEVVKSGELDRNVKLGRGGIREIEFIAQSQQLLHAGRQPFLQGAQTLPCLQKLAQYDLLDPQDGRLLAAAYVFLRDVEHRLQMEENLQTHTIWASRPAQERLARLMGFPTAREFESARSMHTGNVRRIFERMLKSEVGETPQRAFPLVFEGAESEWTRILELHRFRDTEKAFRVLREFVEGPGFGHVSTRTKELAIRLLPRFFALCPGPTREGQGGRERGRLPEPTRSDRSSGVEPITKSARAPLSDPDRVVTRLDSFIAAYGARSTLFELWHSNPGIFELLVLLFDRSEFLAELAIRTPDLVDELVTSGRLRQRKTAAETLADLRYGVKDPDQHLWLRRYHQAELMRIGLRDILGLADFEQYLTELSALADACLQYALEAVMRKHKLRSAPFAVIGLGKLGGAEIDYGSDLDIVFVADNAKAKSLSSLARLAQEFTDLISTRTEQGMLFHIDARLRPDGEKGLLVNTLQAYEGYYRERALLWEIQSLSRSRPIAGMASVGEAFQSLARALANMKQPSLPLAAATGEWKREIHRMRMRIEKERTPAGKGDLAIKTGMGGLMDAEFIAQALCLEHGWQEPSTLKALERAKVTGQLPLADQLIANYRWLRRVEGILRRWSYEGETMLPDDPAPFYRVAIRCGFDGSEAFRAALAGYREKIREVYLKVFRS